MVKRVLVGCERSGVVRDAFASLGFDAWSCDYEPTERPGNHVEDDVLTVAHRGHWDLIIAHPPCTDLAASGARWLADKGDRPEVSLELILRLLGLPIAHIAIENPIGIISTRISRPNQIVQPWWFGHPERKSTCLWLKNLPKLRPTNPVLTFDKKIQNMPDTKERAINRSRTFEGVAKAMASQWGPLL